MNEKRKKDYSESTEKEIVFSRVVKAGKRIYYLDVKKSRKEDMYVAITESKKIVSGSGDESQVSFEKHKIFLYNEDLDKFNTALQEIITYIKGESPVGEEALGAKDLSESAFETSPGIDIDIEF